MDDEYIKLHYDVDSGDFLRGGEASSNIKRVLMKLGIAASITKRTAIACYEAEMNIVIHSTGGHLDVFVCEDKIEIMAEDYGPGIGNVGLAMTEGYSTAPDIAREMGFGGGMGLPNMKKCSDKFEIFSIPDRYTKIKMIINY